MMASIVSVVVGVVIAGSAIMATRRAVRWSRDRRRARRDAELHVRGLPAVVSLLHVATSAGLPPRSAISAVAGLRSSTELEVVLRELRLVCSRLDLGADFSSAILALDVREQRRMIRVLDVLRRAEIDGVALSAHLETLVRDLRRERAVALDVAAQRLTVSLLFPLVVCILPAFVLLAVVPLLLGAFSNLPG